MKTRSSLSPMKKTRHTQLSDHSSNYIVALRKEGIPNYQSLHRIICDTKTADEEYYPLENGTRDKRMEKILKLSNELSYLTLKEICALTARPQEPHQHFHDRALLVRDELHLAKDEYRLPLYRKLYEAGYTLIVPEVYLDHYFNEFPMRQLQEVQVSIDGWETNTIEECIEKSFPSCMIYWGDPIDDDIPSSPYMLGVDTFSDHSDIDMDIYIVIPANGFV